MERKRTSNFGISCRTFHNRVAKCYYYKEWNSYTHLAENLFRRVFRECEDLSDFLPTFTRILSSSCYSGTNIIYKDQIEDFKSYVMDCARNINSLKNKYLVDHILDRYQYKFRIHGYIWGILRSKKDYNLWISYKNAYETQKDVDFACLNNYIYNISQDLDNDCLVFSAPTNCSYIIGYQPRDYTIKQGFLQMTKHKLRLRGSHCISCRNDCKPIIVNGLDRMEKIL